MNHLVSLEQKNGERVLVPRPRGLSIQTTTSQTEALLQMRGPETAKLAEYGFSPQDLHKRTASETMRELLELANAIGKDDPELRTMINTLAGWAHRHPEARWSVD